MNTAFIFVDDWTFYSSAGKKLQITKEDLENYEENGLSMEEVKSLSFSYLTSQNLFSFSIHNDNNEF
jgi:hypothetical protein